MSWSEALKYFQAIGGAISPSLNLDGPFLFETDNLYNIGAIGAHRPANVYIGSNLIVGGPSPWIDVLPSGGDDTAAIQAAFTSATGGAEVRLQGAYTINSPLVVPLTGMAAIRGTAGVNGTIIRAGASFPATGGMLRNASASTLIEGLRIENIQFDANNHAQYGLDLTAFKMPVLYNVRVTGATSHGIFVNQPPTTIGPQMYYVFSYLNGGDGLYIGDSLAGTYGFNVVLSSNTGRGLRSSGTETYLFGSDISNNIGIGAYFIGASRSQLVGGFIGDNGGNTLQQVAIQGASSDIGLHSLHIYHNTVTSAYAVLVDGAVDTILSNLKIVFRNSTTGNAVGIRLGPNYITRLSVIGGTINLPGVTTFGIQADDGGTATFSKITISGVTITSTSAGIDVAGLTASNQAQVTRVANPGLAAVLPDSLQLGPLTILGDPTSSVAGTSPGIYVSIRTTPTSNPATNDFVAGYFEILASNSRHQVWGLNPVVGVPAGTTGFTQAVGMEIDVNNDLAAAPNPQTSGQINGNYIVSGGTFRPSAAMVVLSSTVNNQWKHGLWLDGIGGGVAGSSILTISNGTGVSVTYGFDLLNATMANAAIRVPNNTWALTGRNAAGGADINILKVNASNQIELNGPIFATGNLLFTDNTYTIGAANANRPSELHIGTKIVIAGATDQGLAINTNGFQGFTSGGDCGFLFYDAGGIKAAVLGDMSAAQSLKFRTGGNTTRWTITSAGVIIPGADNSYDIGSTAPAYVKDIYAKGYLRGATLVALGVGAPATLGLIGGSGPATSTQNTWMRFYDSGGNPYWVPVWK